MPEVIVFPDVGAIVIDYLAQGLLDRSVTAAVVSRIPTPVNGNGITVRCYRTGGLNTQKVIDQAQLTLECYAPTAEEAHDVLQLCRGLVHALQGTVQGGVTFYGVNEFAGPVEFPDPNTDTPRYTMTMQVSVRGSAA
jgi:hypothetical protein